MIEEQRLEKQKREQKSVWNEPHDFAQDTDPRENEELFENQKPLNEEWPPWWLLPTTSKFASKH